MSFFHCEKVYVGLRSRTLFAHYFLRRLLSVPRTFPTKIEAASNSVKLHAACESARTCTKSQWCVCFYMMGLTKYVTCQEVEK